MSPVNECLNAFVKIEFYNKIDWIFMEFEPFSVLINICLLAIVTSQSR